MLSNEYNRRAAKKIISQALDAAYYPLRTVMPFGGIEIIAVTVGTIKIFI